MAAAVNTSKRSSPVEIYLLCAQQVIDPTGYTFQHFNRYKSITYNSHQRRAASSNFCKEIFSSATEHAEELDHNVDVILQDQDVRQRHYPGEQNRKEECYGEDVKTLLMTSTRNNIIYLFSRSVLTR